MVSCFDSAITTPLRSLRRARTNFQRNNPQQPSTMSDTSTLREPESSPDDFVMVDESAELPIREKTNVDDQDGMQLKIYSLPSSTDLLVSVIPPVEPEIKVHHVPVDIVLVIDASGSMSAHAPIQDAQGNSKELATGLTISDLTRHAARTILETLNENDRLGIIIFGTEVHEIQPLTFMTPDVKAKTADRIEKMKDGGMTNLWGGMLAGMKMFENDQPTGNTRAMYVLTDGQPNHMCPQAGYVAKLRPLLQKAVENQCCPTIHTFGFGYSIRSDLMQSIAELGGGNYAFIPDAGMIGTVFVHAVANLYTTFRTNAVLRIHATTGSIEPGFALPTDEHQDRSKISIGLGSLRYGQRRDIIIKSSKYLKKGQIGAQLKYSLPHGGDWQKMGTSLTGSPETTSSPETSDYHRFRMELCSILSSMTKPQSTGELKAVLEPTAVKQYHRSLQSLAQNIRSSSSIDDPDVKSILDDIDGEDPAGQILKALSTGKNQNYLEKWGQHYLPSILHAHARQVANSFKDPGPLRYGTRSPMFQRCRDELDTAFDNIPAPKPSGRAHHSQVNAHGRSAMHMSRFNSSANPCFDGDCSIRLADDGEMLVKDLTSVMEVYTPVGPRRVAAVVKTEARDGRRHQLCRVGNLWVTPWHPIKVDDVWLSPADVAEEIKESDSSIFSILLERSTDNDAHAVEVGGEVCVTLGHNVVDLRDARAHKFFADYDAVERSISKLPSDAHGHLLCLGMKKDDETRLACGFL